MFEVSGVNVKIERELSFYVFGATFHTLPLFYLCL